MSQESTPRIPRPTPAMPSLAASSKVTAADGLANARACPKAIAPYSVEARCARICSGSKRYSAGKGASGAQACLLQRNFDKIWDCTAPHVECGAALPEPERAYLKVHKHTHTHQTRTVHFTFPASCVAFGANKEPQHRLPGKDDSRLPKQ